MLRIHMFAPQIGGRVGEAGNPEIVAVDPQNGIAVEIEVESAYWNSVVEKLGRMHGVGIHRANRLPDEKGEIH